MPVFMVERNLQGLSPDQLGAAQKAAIETAQRMTAQGKPVRYLRSTFVPGDARCMCLFEAPRAEHVKELNDAARLPYHTIVEVLDLTA